MTNRVPEEESSICPRCEGTGKYQRLPYPETSCAVCGGSGEIKPEPAVPEGESGKMTRPELRLENRLVEQVFQEVYGCKADPGHPLIKAVRGAFREYRASVGEPGAPVDYEAMQSHFEKGCTEIIDKEIGPYLNELPLPARVIAKANMMDILTAIHTAYENGKCAGLKSAVGEGQKGGWISVDERLPEVEDTVIIWDGKAAYSAWLEDADCEYHYDEVTDDAIAVPYWVTGGEQVVEGVTHWQHLPTPPSTEGEK